MRAWLSAPANITTFCGLCRREIPVGEPMLRLQLAKAVKDRCRECAGEPAPVIVPPAPIPERPVELHMSSVADRAGLSRQRFDAKMARLGRDA